MATAPKTKRRKVDPASKALLKSLFIDEKKIIDGHPFNIHDYTFKNNEPIL